MKYMILLCVMAACCFACSDNEDKAIVPSVSPDAEGTWTDPRDGVSYHWVRYGNLEWLCENVRAPHSAGDAVTCEEVTEEDLPKFGYLYDFTAANTLGVEEWRLPTDEDWKNLEMCLGMSEEEANQTGWRGHFTGALLMQGEENGVGLVCGGYAHDLGGFGTRKFQVDGIYWSSTPDESQEGYAWCRMITFNRDQVNRVIMTTKRYMSVRLVRDTK